MILKMKLNSLKRTLFLLIWMVLPLLSFAGDQADVLFAAGNASYAKGHYKEALASYQKILDGAHQSAAVYFNMGNSSYKLADIPSALLYYEKAHRLSPNDEDIKANIRLANSKTSDKIEEVPEFFLNRWWNSFMLSFSVHTFSIWSIILVLLGSAFLILYFFAESFLVKKSSFFTAILFLFFGVLVLFISGRQVSYFKEHRQAIIFMSPVTVKSAPAEQSGSLFVIHEGMKVNVLGGDNGWFRIRLANGNQGWVKQSELKEI